MKRIVTFRPVRPEDEQFLLDLFTQTHGRALAGSSDAPAMQALVKMQFTIQQQQYAAYENAELQIILVNGDPVGRWYVQRNADEFRVIDIALLPEHQSGVGRVIMRDFLREAANLNLGVRAHVEKSNRAWKLWNRMGFQIVGDTGIHWEILWSPISDREARIHGA